MYKCKNVQKYCVCMICHVCHVYYPWYGMLDKNIKRLEVRPACSMYNKKKETKLINNKKKRSQQYLPTTFYYTVRYMSVIFKKYQMSPLYLKFPISNYFTTTCKMAPAVLFVIVPPKKVQHAFFLIFCL